jgi:hypothetical protein
MKRFAAFAVVLMTGCATLTGQYLSVGEMLSSASQYNGRSARVCGWFVTEMETCTLSVAADPTHPENGTVIWVTPRTDICLPINAFQHPRTTWAIVDGTFYTGSGYGHLGMYRHSLVGGTVTPISGACAVPGSAPNNSFKPKPLRGSA